MNQKNIDKGWRTIVFVLACLFLFFSSTALAVLRPPSPSELPKWLKPWEAPTVPADYRSPGELHKVLIEKGDTRQPPIIKKISPWNVYPYLNRKLYLIPTAELNKLTPEEQKKLTIRDDLNLIRLRDRFFDTTIPQPEIPENLRLVPKDETQLHLVQFVGPVQDDWLVELRRIEGVTVVSYIPKNAYLVWTTSEAREALAELYNLQPYVQWQGPFHPAYKLHPGFDLQFTGEVTATIQLVTHKNVDDSINFIKSKASEVRRDAYRVGPYTNILVKIAAAELVNVARLDDVVNVEPWIEPSMFGERQDQVVAGNLNAAGTGPAAPGYLAWLNELGFTTNFDFAIDITDNGFDQGETSAANVHPDFLDASNNSRVVYVRKVDGTTISTTDDENCGGHGTINAAIAGGFNDTPTTDPDFDYFGDGNNYRYGLGVAPYVLLGSSKILDPWSDPDFTTLTDTAYSNGVRINSNSWGTQCFDPVTRQKVCCGPGTLSDYTADSQEYDALVRDARPSTATSGGEAGNQEMVIIFAAGNEGNCPNEQLGNNGATAKNTIVVGASENHNQAGQDGCDVTNAGANNITDIINFSSRGPTQDNRFKPDIMAPGTHIFGAASQDACFNGSSVCGGPTNDFTAPPNDAYYPADPDTTDTRDQDLYTWSSGTSHACPAVAGGAALLRQWFLNHGHPAPSPAMTKAYLMNSATYMTGAGANDDLPSNNQGMGRMNLGMAFDETPRLLFDQVKTCYRSEAVDASEVFTVEGVVADNTRPFRITLAWTDAPGPTLVNNLDLEVEVGGNFYRGNDFTGATSNAGNVADPTDEWNNVESIFLPAGAAGNFTVRVRPAGINDDGVPNNADLSDQDFALVIYNAEFPPRDPVDTILVLDRSGSMNSIAAGGTEKKIDLLKDAVEMFIRIWEPFSIPEDRMGIIYFNNTITRFPDDPVVLLPFQENANAFIENVRSITAINCTALGGGILSALWGFDGAPGHQKHIIVFTNGMQNCSPMVTDVGGVHRIIYDPDPPCCDSGIPGLNIDISDYDVKAIHTIGTGVAGADWISLITDIARETRGTHLFTTTPDEDLEDYFLDTLVESLRFDPVEKVKTVKRTIAGIDLPKDEFFMINSTARKATFILSWRGEDRLTFDLVSPDGTTIPESLQKVQTGSFYRIATVEFPLSVHRNKIDHAGTWKLIVRPLQTVAQVSYRAHLIIDDAEVRYHFDVPAADYGVGEAVPLSFWIQHGNRTLTNLSGEITATIARPPVGFGTFMVKHPVSKDQLDKPIDLSDDKFPHLADKKSYILVQDSELRKELRPVIDRIALYDDGQPEHGDVKANDGVYSALYKNTKRPGFYNIEMLLKGSIPELGPITRSESKTISVGMKRFDLEKSTIDIKQVRPVEGEVAYEVSILLIDDFGNYLGPGHSLDVVIAPPGKNWGPVGRRVSLNDNLDGIYSGRVELTEEEVRTGAELVIDVGGKRITIIEKPPVYRKWSVSFHSGIAIPTGSFNNNYDPDYSIGLNFDYHFTPQFSMLGLLGYNHFNSGAPSVSDTYWWNISANLKYEFTTGPLRPYANGGIGIYIPESGSTKPGFNAGLGLDYSLTSDWIVELGADYHHIFTSGSDTQFFVPHLGLIFRF